MNGRLSGYARVSVTSDADSNNLETQCRVLSDCEQVFENWRWGFLELAGSESPEGCPPAGRLREDGSAGPLGRSLTEVLELLAWLRENVMEGDLARERILAGLDRVRATVKHLGRHKDVSRKRGEDIQNRRQRAGPGRNDYRAAVQYNPPYLHPGP